MSNEADKVIVALLLLFFLASAFLMIMTGLVFCLTILGAMLGIPLIFLSFIPLFLAWQAIKYLRV